ncbi:Uncharacterized protein conserved in bacteria [[Pasteurella] aerogenes]|nr:Uncharacterized protein conserved in bacteria [[Pasteurella] aerogenes]
MCKKKNFWVVILLVLGGISVYLMYALEIYPSPKSQLYASQSIEFREKKVNEHVQCFSALQSVSPIQQRQFKFLVWNMHKGADSGWQAALASFSAQRDFLLLQEVTNMPALYALNSTQFPTALYTSAFEYLRQQSGVALFSRFMPQQYCAGAAVEPWIQIPKVANAMRFPLANQQSLLLVNVHLVNFELNPTHYAQQLQAMMNLIARHRGPIILAGDFNAWNGWRSQVIAKLVQQYQLQEVHFEPDERLRFFGHPLDFVFVRGLKVLQATTLKTESSDHNPLLLEVGLDVK